MNDYRDPKITQEYIRELFDYDPITGKLSSKVVVNNRSVGDCSNTIASGGYLMHLIHGKKHLVHRLIWLHVYGYLPAAIDHINQNKTDNRLSNLRLADHFINGKNRSKDKNNTSGVTGVVRHKATGKWMAQISDNGKRIYLGTFKGLFDAVCARKSAEIKYGYHENHGSEKGSIL